ncbi:hypothetical protein BGX26_006939 [Mortierella sp. AD094]|nr:hypothetical protein BGX26_006939 [Mortierella sp. AD094]
MFNKTWNIHKTTPFYNFSLLQYDTYEAELLAFIVANARNMSSSTLAQQTPSGVSTFITANRQFPGQIDGSGRSLMETLDDPGDITGIKFQNLNLYDTHMEDDGDSGQFSLMISISVKPKGERKARPIELHYVFPEGVSGLRSISVSLPTDEARQLLVSREEGSDSGFLDGVEAHCTNSMRIDFDRLNLTRAGCSSWYIASEGKVKTIQSV